MDLLSPAKAPAGLPDLFEATFTASEGADEGAAIGALVTKLMDEPEARPFIAQDAGKTIGAIFFSPLTMARGPRVMMLSPVAVATDWQRQGVGQKLISFTLDILREEGEVAAVTYGDPAYYGQVGFRPVSETDVPPPYPLSMPQGWIAQPLASDTLPLIEGPASAVAAFSDPALW